MKLKTAFLLIITIAISLFATSTTLWAQATGKGMNPKKNKKEICITFNELPVAKAFDEVDRAAITYLLLDALDRHDVPAAGFVVGGNIEDAYDILGEWLNGGHLLGSMSQTNEDFNGLSIKKCIGEIRAGAETIEQMLTGFGQKKRYFRYPYLHYGTTIESREQTSMFLAARGTIIAHATIVPEDYLYNLLLDKLGKRPDTTEYNTLMNEYINDVLDELQRVEQLGSKLMKKPVRQILSLRANRLNAVFLDELLGALKDDGYRFISLDRALKDKVFELPESYYGAQGVGYLDMIVDSDADFLPAE